jgi:non-canonical (house-cleaning) NTP pyrophosphatase
MRLAAATTSKQKLGYLKEVLKELGLDFEILSVDVDSGVSDQPMTEQETKQGSINRAQKALDETNNTDLSIGIEVGYHPNDTGKLEIFCFSTIIQRNGVVLSRESQRLLLPDFHQTILREGKYLGDHVRRFIEESPDEYSKQVGEDIRNRKTFIKSAIRSVLTDYIK